MYPQKRIDGLKGRESFADGLLYFLQNDLQRIIFGGDFNCVTSTLVHKRLSLLLWLGRCSLYITVMPASLQVLSRPILLLV